MLGEEAADRLLEGGLRADGLHEVYAAGAGDGPAALGFTLLLAHLRQRMDGKPTIWVRNARGPSGRALPYGPGLCDLGSDPEAFTVLCLPDGRAVLRAGLDAVRHGSVAAVLVELHGKQPLLDLTATRRLTLAAAETGTMVLIARGDAIQTPSAAHSRWRVAAAPSTALEADAPGAPAFALTLTRHRGGREGACFLLEWNRDSACFAERRDGAPLSRAAAALDAERTSATRRDRAA